MTSKYKIAEQIQRILAGGTPTRDRQVTIQELMISVTQELGTAVKQSWFAGRQDGVSEINGTFIYSFNNVAVQKDTDTDIYYSTLPASFIDLPNEMGVHSISLMKSQSKPFTRLANGYNFMFEGLQANRVLSEQQTFYIQNDKAWYPNMEASDSVSNVLMKLAVSLDGIDQDADINISPEIQSQIITAVVQKYGVEQTVPKDIKNDNVKA